MQEIHEIDANDGYMFYCNSYNLPEDRQMKIWDNEWRKYNQ